MDHLGWVASQVYAIGGLGFGVRTTSAEFGAWLESALASYRVEFPDAQPHYSIVIADDESRGGRFKEQYHALYKGSLAIAKTPDLRALVQTLFADLESFLYDERDDAVFVDMVPISLDGTTALAPQILMPYLASLGRRRLARSGLSFPAETAVAVDPDTGRVVPTRTMVDVADRSLESLADIFPIDGRDELSVVDRPLPIDVVMSIGWGDEPLQPISRGLALYRAAAHAANLERLGVRAIEGLRTLVQPARCFELGSGKPALMLEGLATALRSV